MFVECLINECIEKTSKSRSMAGHFLNKLVMKNILMAEQYLAGLAEVFMFAGDLLVDIPNFFGYMGEIIGE